jgi:hypothetical protein
MELDDLIVSNSLRKGKKRPGGARILSIFWICVISDSPLRRFTASSPPNVIATANQESRQSRWRPRQARGRIDANIMDDMRSGPNRRPRGRFNANRPFREQPRIPQNGQTFVSNGPNIKIRGSAHQIFERYLTLAREATANGDRIAAENSYQQAEHYFRINNARRESNQQGTLPRSITPDDVEMNLSEADSREVDVDRFRPGQQDEDCARAGVSQF